MSINLIPQPTIDPKGNITDEISDYKPDKRTRARFVDLRREFEKAERIRTTPYEEINLRDVITYQNDCQRAFNTFVPPKSTDPDLSWRAQTTNALTRNKVISIAAHVTASVLFPDVIAQNADSSEDKDAAVVMKDLMEYSFEQSKYSQTFLNAVIAMLVNPCAIVHEGYTEVKRTVKEITGENTWKEKEVIDETFSGFQNIIVPVDEFFIGDVYEPDIQKQPFLIWRRIINFQNAEIKYKKFANFKFVRPGLRHFYGPDQDTFYQQWDENMHDNLVEEIVYYNRLADLELRVVNGVLMDDPDRPLQRQDKMYPFVANGYERTDEGRFFYFKSLCDKLFPDQQIVDRMYNMIIDGTYLQIIPPMASFGDDIITADVVRPGVVTQMQGDSKLENLSSNINLNAGIQVLKQVVEPAADNSSQDPRSSGQQVSGGTTAFEISRLEENAKTILGLFGKQIIQFVEDFGTLRKNTILQHMVVGQAEQVLGDINNIKFKNILIPDREEDGERFTKRVEFNTELPETEEEQEEASFKLMEKEEKLKGMRIAQVNPEEFRNRDFKTKVNADFIGTKSKAVEKALNLEAYDRAIANPLIANNPEKLALVTKDFLFSNYKPGEEDKYVGSDSPIGNITADIPGRSPVNAVATAERTAV